MNMIWRLPAEETGDRQTHPVHRKVQEYRHLGTVPATPGDAAWDRRVEIPNCFRDRQTGINRESAGQIPNEVPIALKMPGLP